MWPAGGPKEAEYGEVEEIWAGPVTPESSQIASSGPRPCSS